FVSRCVLLSRQPDGFESEVFAATGEGAARDRAGVLHGEAEGALRIHRTESAWAVLDAHDQEGGEPDHATEEAIILLGIARRDLLARIDDREVPDHSRGDALGDRIRHL